MGRKCVQFSLGILLILTLTHRARGIELSHYSSLPGMAFLDDLFLPPPEAGRVFYAQYNSYYGTDTFRDSKGNKLKEITITGPAGRPITIKVDLDVDNWVIAPLLLWSPGWEVLGARYGGYLLVPVGNPSIAADLQTEIGIGRSVEESTWDLGDIYFQPVWLQWSFDRVDVTGGYGFYAPSGKYKGGDNDNVGLGFWAHQLQSAVRYHIDETSAAMLSLTGEINHNKKDADITPGPHLTLNWGARKRFLDDWLQFGVIGYDTWQVGDDHGADAGAPSDRVRDQVHAAGFEISVPRFGLAVKYMHEFGAEDRFEGQMVSVFFALPLDPVLAWMGVPL